MSLEPGKREARTENFLDDPNLMAEKTKLPNLDYTALQIASLTRLKQARTAEAKGPTGRYDALAAYLGQRSGGASDVNVAEIDRRVRTWFEDLINKVLASPAEWDQDRVMNGKALMDYLAGTKVQTGPSPEAPPR